MRRTSGIGKRRAGGPRPMPDRGTILGLRCSIAWRDWLDGLAEHCRLHKVDVIDLAVVEYAHQIGYTDPAPRR